MNSTRFITAVVLGAVLLVALTACGSGSSTTTVTTTGGTSERLSARSWTNYQTLAAKSFDTTNKATSKFAYCGTLVAQGSSKSLIDSCYVTSTSAVVAQGQEVNGFLQALMLETEGDCNAALTTLDDDVKAFVSAAETLDEQAKAGKVPSESDVTAAKDALTKARSSKDAVEPACAPETS